ncbi:9749_t:CDS:2, partial [Gigaspora rosea]
ANGTLALYYKDHKYEYMCLNCYNAIVVNGPSTYVEHAAEWAKGLKRRRNDNISMTESISLLTNIIFEKEVIGNDLPIVTFSQLKVIAIDKNDQLGFFFNEWLCMAIPLWNLKDELTASDNNLSWVDSVNVLTKLLYDREKNEEEPIIYSFKQLRKEMVAKDFRLNGFFDSIYNASLSKNRTFKKDISLFVDLMGVSAEAIDVLSYADGIYMKRMAKTFYDQFYYEVSLDEKLENMTLHKYDSRIQEHQEELKIKDAILLNFFESGLKEIDSQVFTWQAITLRLLNCENITNCILSFVPIIGYQYVFSTSKALSISPSPYRIF